MIKIKQTFTSSENNIACLIQPFLSIPSIYIAKAFWTLQSSFVYPLKH